MHDSEDPWYQLIQHLQILLKQKQTIWHQTDMCDIGQKNEKILSNLVKLLDFLFLVLLLRTLLEEMFLILHFRMDLKNREPINMLWLIQNGQK